MLSALASYIAYAVLGVQAKSGWPWSVLKTGP